MISLSEIMRGSLLGFKYNDEDVFKIVVVDQISDNGVYGPGLFPELMSGFYHYSNLYPIPIDNRFLNKCRLTPILLGNEDKNVLCFSVGPADLIIGSRLSSPGVIHLYNYQGTPTGVSVNSIHELQILYYAIAKKHLIFDFK